MNHTLNTMNTRRSVRAYSDRPVEPETRQLIIDAARRAPTAGNQQLYTIIDIKAQDIKDHLALSCDNQPFIAKAPMLLLFLADFHRTFKLFLASGAEEYCRRNNLSMKQPGAAELLLSLDDALIAAQNSVVAAESLGVGTCYIGDIMENWEFHRDLFKLPEFVFPAALVCYGYPKGAPVDSGQGISPRFDEKYIVFSDHYQSIDDEDLRKMVEPLEKKYHRNGQFHGNAENMGQDIFGRKYMSDFSREMERSILEALKTWQGIIPDPLEKKP